MKQWLKSVVESTLAVRVYRGWYPRGMDLAFDIGRLVSAERPVIFDVGANVGKTAMGFLSGHPTATIHAFEPVSTTFAMLSANTRFTNQITAHQLAVGATSGVSDIQIYEGNVNNSLKKNDDQQCLGTERITVTTLDDFCQQQGIARIDFLKIDTEGFDLEVVRGADTLFQKHAISVVVAELGFSSENRKHVSFCDFLREMQTRGMELFGIYDQRREFTSVQQLRRADCMFVCRHQNYPKLVGAADV